MKVEDIGSQMEAMLNAAALAGVSLKLPPEPPSTSLAAGCGNNRLQQTLAIIKPDGMARAEEIINILRREGLAILQARRVELTAEQAASFYQDLYEMDWFGGNVANLSSGPLLAMVVSGPAAIHHLTELTGPASLEEREHHQNSLRYQFGTKNDEYANAIHASSSESDALRELHFFFPEIIVEPLLGDDLASHYLNQNVHPVLTVGLSKLVREKPDDPVMWLADWLLANNPNKPKELNAPNRCK